MTDVIAAPYISAINEHHINLLKDQFEKFNKMKVIPFEYFNTSHLELHLDQLNSGGRDAGIRRKIRNRIRELDICREVFDILENHPCHTLLVASQQLDPTALGRFYRDIHFLDGIYNIYLAKCLFKQSLVDSLPRFIVDLIEENTIVPVIVFFVDYQSSKRCEILCMDHNNFIRIFVFENEFNLWSGILHFHLTGNYHSCVSFLKTSIRTSPFYCAHTIVESFVC